MKIGLIGFGRLGQLLTKYLAQDFHVYVYDPQLVPEQVVALGAIPASLEEVCAQPAILPLVPISVFETVIEQIAPLIQPGTLLIDCCSVKIKPVEAMLKHLSEEIDILATHPMFGPDSAADTLFGAKLVLCPVRIEPKRYSEIKAYLEKHGIKLIESTPEEHDRQISQSLFLSHFLGRTLLELNVGPLEIDTKGYRRMMKILLTVQNDSWQLFEDMYHFNPHASDIHQDFLAAMQRVTEHLLPS